jgi:hypothetical protein
LRQPNFENDYVELYNLADDLGERNELSRAMPDMAQRLEQQLQDWLVEVKAQRPEPNPSRT